MATPLPIVTLALKIELVKRSSPKEGINLWVLSIVITVITIIKGENFFSAFSIYLFHPLLIYVSLKEK